MVVDEDTYWRKYPPSKHGYASASVGRADESSQVWRPTRVHPKTTVSPRERKTL